MNKTLENLVEEINNQLVAKEAGYTATLTEVSKNNGVKLNGISIHGGMDDSILPTFYLNGAVEAIEAGEETIASVAERYVKSIVDVSGIDSYFSVDELDSWDYVSQHVFPALVSTSKNASLLESIPSRPVAEDLAIVYRVLVHCNKEGIGTFLLKNDFMAQWPSISEDMLYAAAVINASRLFKVKVVNIFELMAELMMEELVRHNVEPELFDALFKAGAEEYDVPIKVITNQYRLQGASAIIWSDALESVAAEFDSDLYVIPSSIHECIAFPKNSGSPDVFRNMIAEVNQESVPPEDVLSDNLYEYSRKNGKLSMVRKLV